MNDLGDIIGQYYGIDWAAMLLQCTSIILLALHLRSGFLWATASNGAWFAFGLLTQSVADLIAQLIMIGLNVYGFAQWKSEPDQSTFSVRPPSWLEPFPFPSV